MSHLREICLVVVLCLLTFSLLCDPFSSTTPKVKAQAQTQLVPLVTDQTPLALSNQFGVPFLSLLNQAGDYAFLGRTGGALFSRPAGASAPVRVFQMADEVPGWPGSRSEVLTQARLNNSGLLAFRVDLFLTDGTAHNVIFTYDESSLQQIVASTDLAPGGGGAKFERAINLFGLNDSGTLCFTAPLVPVSSGLPAQTTAYIVPNGGAPIRLVGLGDTAPGTGGGTFGSVAPVTFNNAGELMFRAAINGGPGGIGVFVASTAGVRKVVVPGDPRPEGGLFGNPGNALFNNQGEVVFQAGAIYLNHPTNGTTRVVTNTDPAPASLGGTFGPLAQIVLQTFNDAGEIAFTAGVIGSGVTNFGLFRFRPSNPTEVVAYRNQAVPGLPGQTFDQFAAISINSSGAISFRGNLIAGPVPYGIFRQTGSNSPVTIALSGDPTSLAGGGNHSFENTTLTRTLNDNSVFFTSEIPGGTADYGEFLDSGGSISNLMNTGDNLPAGARVVLRTFKPGAAGDFVGFLAARAGGRASLAVHNIATQSTSIITTDGDVAPETGGGRLSVLTPNTIFVNSSGKVAFAARILGGSESVNSAIYVGTPGGNLSKVVIGNEVDAGTGRTFTALNLNLVTPSAINDAGQVVFTTQLSFGPNLIRGLFVGSVGTTPAKIAVVGDMLSDGRTLQNFFGTNGFWINSSGQVLFPAATTGGTGLYVGSPGTTPVKVVASGDDGPGGSAFIGFAPPAFNDSGEVAFLATLTGGPAGGVFVGSTSGPPVALALDGNPAPAGGNFSINVLRADVLINNQHDVVFRANLTGGTADSGYFVRRGPSGSLQAPILQGQPAPGTTGNFTTIVAGLNNLAGELFQLSPTGDLAFQSFFQGSGERSGGTWHLRTDNTIEEIIVRGIVAPEFGGGVAVISTASTAWNSNGRYAVWARISGGTFTEGIFLYVPVVGTNTPTGTSVPVNVTDSTTGTTPVSLNFANVTTAGNTSLTTSSGGPAIPTAFALGDPPVFYNISTTATFTGSIGVCIDFSNITFPPGSDLRLLHFENGGWVDVTTSGPTGNVICGSVTSLSPFTVVRRLVTALGPANVWIGLKNSDDVGTKFDLLAEVLRNGVVIGSGQLNDVAGGSSGFNNAHLRTIPLSLTPDANCCNGPLSFRLSVRIAASSGHRSGTARLWYNDALANSRIDAALGSTTKTYFLLNLFNLGPTAGPGPKKTSDVKVDRAANGNPFKPFGTWTITSP